MKVAKTENYRLRLRQLEEDQSTWKPHWKDISEYMLPRKGAYLDSTSANSKPNDGSKLHQKILNGSASDALRTIAAGMQGGLTSPARPWFALGLPDEDLMEFSPVRDWLHRVRNVILSILARSNFYDSIHGQYKELAAFGVSAMMLDEDTETYLRCRPFTIGEFKLALNGQYRPDTLYRQFSLTARQIVQLYGLENVSDVIRACQDNKQTEKRFEIVNAIEPNDVMDPGKMDARGMMFKSCHFELACDPDKVLKESGYRVLPFVAPRWDVTGVDTYGQCPGMDALGDVKMLQKMEEKKLKALDKMVDPPMNAPSSLKQKGGTIVAGGVNYIDVNQGQQGFTPVYQVNPNMQQLAIEIDRIEQRIRRFFFNDLFLSILNSEKVMTATEVAKRHDEKLMMLGPVIERLHNEMLDPIIDRVFDIATNRGLLPPPPQEIQGMAIKVEYISLLAQAQKMVGTTAIEQVAAFAGNLSAVNPSVLDKLDFDEALDQYAEMVGVPPKIVRSDDEVEKIRKAKQEQQAAAAATQANMQLAQGAKVLSDAKVGQNSALDVLMGNPSQGGS